MHMMTNAKDPNLQPESEASPLRAGEDACKKVLGSCDADLFEINLVNTEDQKLGQAWTGSPLFVVLCSTSSSSAVRSRCRMTSYLTRQARNQRSEEENIAPYGHPMCVPVGPDQRCHLHRSRRYETQGPGRAESFDDGHGFP